MGDSKDTFESAKEALREKIRKVPDFPEKGVLFEDLTPVLADAHALRVVIKEMARVSENLGADLVGGLDARGFLLGSAVAYEMGVGILAIRKKGKLPPPVITQEYKTEYSTAALEIPASGIDLDGKKVVLVDDVLATGGTLSAATDLIQRAGGSVVGYVVMLEVQGLDGRSRLGDVPVVVLDQ
ncbi:MULTISPECIES: adenine phosphoribosyltransferase [Corynebacterium]|uniref:Adenine phosphoribosyltransferase n=1 Tax=Corynebacterium lipophilum TaxID=2804918 RepID=A0AAW5HT75_9CORY|nr:MULTISPECIES: adenine phosphoribosyltransferase [Corynebacterium]MCO6393613.1 adenine phosphoribosyltransferase [Corynebacterium lipophilum]MCZ2117023.1 adenine phosphoribosyltransferase [Corynebacterium lipophilum]MDK8243830.1 adenine phosphoribosyltransferase [Corynebacterium sp. UMB10321]MDK8363143.1 adenine phosphoribosyltransferase [Corynebacterium sp. UMB10119B]OFT31395.1 adenine phosphoribosyltransferase [Corynebacterium sp. HMSC08D02]